jgi:hypothetical protein
MSELFKDIPEFVEVRAPINWQTMIVLDGLGDNGLERRYSQWTGSLAVLRHRGGQQ